MEHDNINVLVLGSRVIGTELAKDLAATFLKARFTAEDRRQLRLAKVINLEKKYATAAKAPEMKQ